MKEQLSRHELERLASRGEELKEEVREYVEQVVKLPKVADPEHVAGFLARCAAERAESAAVSMADRLRDVYGDRPTGERVPEPQPLPSIPPPPDVEHVAGRMSKGNTTEVYTGLMLRSSDTKTYHAVRTFGKGKGEKSICGAVTKSNRTGEAPIRDLEVLKCEPCGRCFSGEVIPLSLREQLVQAKNRLAENKRWVRELQEQVAEHEEKMERTNE